MFLVGSSYWNIVYGNAIEEVKQDEEGIENMKKSRTKDGMDIEKNS